MPRAGGRVVAFFIALVACVMGIPWTALGQGPGTELPDQPAMPVRQLVAIPVPAEPRRPGSPGDASDVAARWFAASSDTERRDIVLETLAGIGIGVYTMDGTPILVGAERSVDDPWLYDFEVALLAGDPATVAPVTIRDIAATLESAVSTSSGEPVSGELVADAVSTGLARALREPADPAGFPLRLARELERQSSGLDLAQGMPVDEPLTTLAASMIAIDLILGLGEAGAGTTALAGITSVTGVAGRSPRLSARGPFARPLADGSSVAPGGSAVGSVRSGLVMFDGEATVPMLRTAQGCGSIVGSPDASSWNGGWSGVALTSVGTVVAGPIQTIAQLLHANALLSAIQPVFGANPKKIHLRHRDAEPAEVLAFAIDLDVELPSTVASCGPLAGVRLPPPGWLTNVPVTWDASTLADQGTVTCGSRCTSTGEMGWSELGFLAKVEPAPVNLGPIQEARTAVVVRADLAEVFGALVPSVSFVGPVWLSRHQPYEFDLVIDSSIRGTGLGRYAATASGKIRIRDQAGSLLGTGMLQVTSRPQGRADGCRQQYTSSGAGEIDMQVYGLQIHQFTNKVIATIGPGPALENPDKLTSPACPPYKPRAVTAFSTWEHAFVDSHRRKLKKGAGRAAGGLELSGWKWKADDETFRSGGVLATLDYPERCSLKVAGCKGVTHFKLMIWPIED